jgi:hypothetical protein
MRIIILIISSLLLLAFFGIKSYSIDWNNPEYYQSIDDLISSGNGYVFVPLSEQAQASRSDQAGQPGKDILSLPFGSNSATTPRAKSKELNQTAISPIVAANADSLQAKSTNFSELARVPASWPLNNNSTALKCSNGVSGTVEINRTITGANGIFYNLSTNINSESSIAKYPLNKNHIYRLILIDEGPAPSLSNISISGNNYQSPAPGTIEESQFKAVERSKVTRSA